MGFTEKYWSLYEEAKEYIVENGDGICLKQALINFPIWSDKHKCYEHIYVEKITVPAKRFCWLHIRKTMREVYGGSKYDEWEYDDGIPPNVICWIADEIRKIISNIPQI
jgi:hypothetical protein